jgi:regulatory protein
MDLLARREHSHAELLAKLMARDIPSGEAEEAVDELAQRGLVSDERFAESFVTMRARKGHGPVRIRAELRQRGVSTTVIDAQLDACPGDWDELAGQVRRKKFGTAVPADFKQKARQMRFLQYRGFTTDQIQAAFAAFGADCD